MDVIIVSQNEAIAVETESSTTVVTGLMGPPGPQGPTGPQGQGLAVTDAVNSISQLPASGSPGDSIYVAETGKIYIWSSV